MKKIVFFSILHLAYLCSAQKQIFYSDESKTYYNLFDSLTVSENKDVFNGHEFVDAYRGIKPEEHRYFGNNNFYEGYVFYNGQPYFNISIKYDVLEDMLILELPNKGFKYISLNSNLVRVFKLGNNTFVKLNESDALSADYKNGFFKSSYTNSKYSLFTKLKKTKHKKIANKRVYYTFKLEENYFLAYKDKYFKIQSIKDLQEALPEEEKDIRLFFDSNKRLFKSNKQEFLIEILENLNN